MNAQEITEAMFAPYKRNLEAYATVRQNGEKFHALCTEQTRAAYDAVCKMQDKAIELAARQGEALQKYVEKQVEIALVAFKAPAA